MAHQIVNIILLKSELQHNIESDITSLERARSQTDHPVTINTDDYTLSRIISQAINHAVSCMQAYLVLPSTDAHRITTNHTHQWQERSITLSLPRNWPPQLIDDLRDAIHTYTVRQTEYKVLLPILPNDSFTALCLDEANTAYNAINSLINTRLGPIHTHPTTFG